MRIENIGANVSEYCEATGEGSSTFDVCADCLDDVLENPEDYMNDQLQPYNGDPAGEGFSEGVEHPPYTDGDEYQCAVCGKVLTDEDD